MENKKEMEEAKVEEQKKVMVAIDESECSRIALEWTLDNLKSTIADSKLIIFTAQPVADLGYACVSSYGAAPVDLITNIQEKGKKAALALLEKAKDICAKHGIVAEMVTEAGDPKVLICETVQKLNIQLLVLGSHSRGVIKRAILGSVSNYCTHNATCPVLVVKKSA